MINVTQTYLPPLEDYISKIAPLWNSKWITNNGELVQQLEAELKDFCQSANFLYCSNGTVALQLALKALNIAGEVITTPFSYVATTNVIMWENCTPVFVDIDPLTFCIDASKIEAAITPNTQAILATHVYGFPCDVEKIESIALKHGLKVIYDGAHAFGCFYKGKSLLNYGDISTCSFHATKIFHTVEGGGIISKDMQTNKRLSLLRSFGHVGDDYFQIGINGKNSEFHDAMGLAILPSIHSIIASREQIFKHYETYLPPSIKRPNFNSKDFKYNYAYHPVIFEDEKSLLKARDALALKAINTRRYFYPSLNQLPHTSYLNMACPVSEDISSRILCLPLYPGLKQQEIETICSIISSALL